MYGMPQVLRTLGSKARYTQAFLIVRFPVELKLQTSCELRRKLIGKPAIASLDNFQYVWN
jgi:hypothetical protein